MDDDSGLKVKIIKKKKKSKKGAELDINMDASSSSCDSDGDEMNMIDDDELGNHENYKLFAEFKVRNAGYDELAL